MNIIPIECSVADATAKFFEELDEVEQSFELKSPLWHLCEELGDVATVCMTLQAVQSGDWTPVRLKRQRDNLLTPLTLRARLRVVAGAQLSPNGVLRYQRVTELSKMAYRLAITGLYMYAELTGKKDLPLRVFDFVRAKNALRYYNEGGLSLKNLLE